MDKVSVIIPTYNRFNFLLNAIESVKKQTYKNIEIIIINDCSTENSYYNYNFENDLKIINLEKNSKDIFGYACVAYVRNIGINESSGYYIAFLDDDDIWFPNKLELQINAMKNTGCKMSSTDALFGNGIYNPNIFYEKMLGSKYYNMFKEVFNNEGNTMLNNGYPKIWTKELVIFHNLFINSSVIVEKNILNLAGNMKNLKAPGEDYECWLRILDLTNSVYIEEECLYYDSNHGNGQNY
jgi:teichuronic acid biosynthesis glycosyltransferase TuaG